jgi:hypothetical protein
MGDRFCGECGEGFISEAARFCARCGAGRARSGSDPALAVVGGGQAPTFKPAITATASAASSGEPTAPARTSAGAGASNPLATLDLPVVAGLPGEIWVATGALAIPGAWVLIDALRALPDAFDLINAAFFGWKFGTLVTLLVIGFGLVGLGLLANAILVLRGDRSARWLAWTSAGTVTLATIFTNGRTDSLWAAVIGSIVAATLLTGAPNARAHLGRSQPAVGGAPASVRAASLALFAFYPFAVLGMAIYLIYASTEAKWYLALVLFAVMAVVAALRQTGILRGDRRARLELSVAGVAFVLLVLIFTKHAAQLIVAAGLVASVLALVWLPEDARAFFGDTPLVQSRVAGAAAPEVPPAP